MNEKSIELIKFPIRISMSGYSVKDHHGRILFKMEMNGDSWKDSKKIEQFLSDAEQIVNLVNEHQQLIKEAKEQGFTEGKAGYLEAVKEAEER